jgi:hypothetical protein
MNVWTTDWDARTHGSAFFLDSRGLEETDGALDFSASSSLAESGWDHNTSSCVASPKVSSAAVRLGSALISRSIGRPTARSSRWC